MAIYRDFRKLLAFSHLGKYAGKSLDSPLFISHCTLISYPCREMKQNDMTTFKLYTNEAKDTILDSLKVKLKGVIVLTLVVESAEDDYLGDHKPIPLCENSVPSGHKKVLNKSNDGICMSVLRRIEKNKKKQEAAVDEDHVVVVNENLATLVSEDLADIVINEVLAAIVNEDLAIIIVDEDLIEIGKYIAEGVDEVVEEKKEHDKKREHQMGREERRRKTKWEVIR
ncbi:hypothetical protein H5410_041808 [Solanum commersonii]|uniref:Uncharacterized protein n=1 Tax=Solanum commersonii TaxID=4109 RepID=A0A9J5XWN1_SOLCO|nr:hypothetical protein H5410_041808 [Solanum commersonii]